MEETRHLVDDDDKTFQSILPAYNDNEMLQMTHVALYLRGLVLQINIIQVQIYQRRQPMHQFLRLYNCSLRCYMEAQTSSTMKVNKIIEICHTTKQQHLDKEY